LSGGQKTRAEPQARFPAYRSAGPPGTPIEMSERPRPLAAPLRGCQTCPIPSAAGPVVIGRRLVSAPPSPSCSPAAASAPTPPEPATVEQAERTPRGGGRNSHYLPGVELPAKPQDRLDRGGTRPRRVRLPRRFRRPQLGEGRRTAGGTGPRPSVEGHPRSARAWSRPLGVPADGGCSPSGSAPTRVACPSAGPAHAPRDGHPRGRGPRRLVRRPGAGGDDRGGLPSAPAWSASTPTIRSASSWPVPPRYAARAGPRGATEGQGPQRRRSGGRPTSSPRSGGWPSGSAPSRRTFIGLGGKRADLVATALAPQSRKPPGRRAAGRRRARGAEIPDRVGQAVEAFESVGRCWPPRSQRKRPGFAAPGSRPASSA